MKEMNDNRKYDYSGGDFYVRPEFTIISDWIPAGSSVIDLGCGNGSLAKYLEPKGVKSVGVESVPSGVQFALSHGLNARQGNIDEEATYKNFVDNQFDFAVCNVSIQMVMYPEVLIKQMKRISRRQIFSFPNFAFFGNRFDLFFYGRMPRPMLHGYSWYNTGHIHQFSLKDFKESADKFGLKIDRQTYLGCYKYLAKYIWPNGFAKAAVLLTSK